MAGVSSVLSQRATPSPGWPASSWTPGSGVRTAKGMGSVAKTTASGELWGARARPTTSS